MSRSVCRLLGKALGLLCAVPAVLIALDRTPALGVMLAEPASPFPQALVAEVLPGGDRNEAIEGLAGAATVYRDGELLGWVASTEQLLSSVGFTGRPLDILVGLDPEGRITGARLLRHDEPILIIGIDPEELAGFVSAFTGHRVDAPLHVARSAPDGEAGVDALSGATVSSVLIGDAILRTARRLATTQGLLATRPEAAAGIDLERFTPMTWHELERQQALSRLQLFNREIDARFAERGVEADATAALRDPDDLFLDFAVALGTPAAIGRNLLGDSEWARLSSRLQPGDHALILMARGLYSVKGTRWVRSGTFERLQLIQGEHGIPLEAAGHHRIDALAAEGAPEFRELGWFVVPAGSGFDPRDPWRVEVLIERRDREGASHFLNAMVQGSVPESLIASTTGRSEPTRLLERLLAATADPDGPHTLEPGLWLEVWRDRGGRIAMVSVMMVVLTLVLACQGSLVRRAPLYDRLRLGFLLVTLFWLGLYAGVQLSVVNVLTFVQALLTGFSWDLFLMEPVTFILWSYVAVALLFWGRGVFCGWLCPFGALQELSNRAARWLKVPQFEPSFAVNERLWLIKYMIFLGLFALSLHSMTAAVLAAEVEPFKTVITMHLARSWPFVAFALAFLVAGLFVQRFYCRYVCPLGAALAIPARLAMVRWLRRRPQCGRECHICARHCPVQAIHPSGEINPNECVQCLACQIVLHDERICPPLIQRRRRREGVMRSLVG